MHRRPRRPPGDVIQRRRRAQPTRDQRAHHLTDRQDRPGAARQAPVDGLPDSELAQEVLDQQQRTDTPPGPGHRRIQTRERSRQRLQLPRLLQRILPPKVCHNTMSDLAVLITVALDQLNIAIRAPTALHLRLLDKHVATTLEHPADGNTASLHPELPQHHRPQDRTKQPQTPPTTGQTPAPTPTQPRKQRGEPAQGIVAAVGAPCLWRIARHRRRPHRHLPLCSRAHSRVLRDPESDGGHERARGCAPVSREMALAAGTMDDARLRYARRVERVADVAPASCPESVRRGWLGGHCARRSPRSRRGRVSHPCVHVPANSELRSAQRSWRGVSVTVLPCAAHR